MEHGMLGQYGTVGAKWNGAKWHHAILPPKVFHFAPMPWSVLPHAHSTHENFSDESGKTVLGRGS